MNAKFLRAVVFLTGFCLMVVELTASRVLAPYLGVSVYSWTAVIGIVLVGISCGNFFGGMAADRGITHTRFAYMIVLSGISVVLSNYLAPVIGNGLASQDLPLWMKTIFFVSFVFFPTAFFLSTITPMAAKFDIQNLATVGKRIGSLYAWSTIGNLLGVASAGFFLISLLGSKFLLTLTSILLLGMGVIVAWPAPIWKQRLTVVVALFLTGDFLVPGICHMETNYYCVRVSASSQEGIMGYVLRLDHLIHSYVYPSAPERVGYGYEHVYTNLLAYRYKETDAFSALFVGGGGYSLPRYMEQTYPSSTIMVAEIDPGVTEANHRLMELSRDTRIQTVNEDARRYLGSLSTEKRFDVVFGDAFNDFSVPYHLTTVEFHSLLKKHMSEGGVYALNIIDDARYGRFLASMVRTLGAVWEHVYVAPGGRSLGNGRNTVILMATDRAIDREQWIQLPPQIPIDVVWQMDEWKKSIALLDQQELDAFMATHTTPALTDDFAPTDRYLAPVFADAY